MKIISPLFFLLMLTQFSFANIITVTTNIDENSANGQTSLREAIDMANATPGKDTIVFSNGTNGNVFLLDIGSSNEDNNADGDLDILDTDGIYIKGNGIGNTIIDGNQTERIFHNLDGSVFMEGLSLQHGNAQDALRNGGAFYVNKSNLQFSFSNMEFKQNKASNSGGAMYLSGGSNEDFLIAAPMEFRFIKGGDSALANTYTRTPDSTFINLDLIDFAKPSNSKGYLKKLLDFFADVERKWVDCPTREKGMAFMIPIRKLPLLRLLLMKTLSICCMKNGGFQGL